MSGANETSGGGSVQIDVPDGMARALRGIVNVLGPDEFGCDDCRCAGCMAEGAEALRIAQEALGLVGGCCP